MFRPFHPRHHHSACHRRGTDRGALPRWLPSLALTSQPPPAAAATSLPIGVWPLGSHRRGAGQGGHASLHTSHDIGTATQPHWHTPHPTPTPLRAWGAQRGDCERVCGRASRPQSRPSAAPISPAIQPHYAGPVAKLLFESQAERSRPWFAQVHASVRGLAFSIQSYANPGIRRAEVRPSTHCSQSAARRPACSTAHGGAGQGGTGRCRAISPSTRPSTPRPPPGHITPAVGPD